MIMLYLITSIISFYSGSTASTTKHRTSSDNAKKRSDKHKFVREKCSHIRGLNVTCLHKI